MGGSVRAVNLEVGGRPSFPARVLNPVLEAESRRFHEPHVGVKQVPVSQSVGSHDVVMATGSLSDHSPIGLRSNGVVHAFRRPHAPAQRLQV